MTLSDPRGLVIKPEAVAGQLEAERVAGVACESERIDLDRAKEASRFTESGLQMTDRLVHTQYEFLRTAIDSTAKSLRSRDGAKLQGVSSPARLGGRRSPPFS